MERARLKLAFDRLEAEHWSRFEQFASEFLVTDYPNLRTVASASGDQGRDAELFSPDGLPSVVLQYSVSRDWKTKIRDTAQRVSYTLPAARVLIYVTNRPLLSQADELKRELIAKHGLVLDVLDQSWFLDRFRGDPHREAVSEALAKFVVDPYLAGEGILRRSAPVLTQLEYQAALTYLQLQWEDDTREKGLTRMSFEALIRTVLRDTSSDTRLSRQQIRKSVTRMLPSHDPKRIESLVDSALRKMTKRFIRHWVKEDEFCLTFEESQRMRERLADLEAANTEVDAEIVRALEAQIGQTKGVDEFKETLCKLTRNALNRYLLYRGEAFAAAVTTGRLDRLGFEGLERSVEVSLADAEVPNARKNDFSSTIFATVQDLLIEPSESIQRHLRSKADAYTLFAFLRETPDVQSAVSKMFSEGTIWLDTTILLPLFAEELIEEEHRRFTKMLRVARGAGLALRITGGVLEEVERHMNRSLAFARLAGGKWRGRIPFLISAFIQVGRPQAAFGGWLERFRGPERPNDDLAEFLNEFHGIELENLEEDVSKCALELRATVQEVWHQAHTRRREKSEAEMDDLAFQRLVRHDVENYLGVVQRRHGKRIAPLGYTAWWLTLDHVAFQVESQIKDTLGADTPSSPVMSADFLVNYLSIGPIRVKISKADEANIPVALDVGLIDVLNPELIAEAERIRQEAGELEEHVIRRRVRDHLDAAKRRTGELVRRGVDIVLDDLAEHGGDDA